MTRRLLLWLSFIRMATAGEASACERLKATLTYTQEEAPRDLSSVVPVVVEKVNRVLDGVVDVNLEWNGADLHGRVGEHIVECTVTRLASAVSPQEGRQVFEDEGGRQVTSQCFHVPFTILDTNECTLPNRHPMRHACSSPAICVNTIGSYECVCPTLKKLPLPETADKSFFNSLETQNRVAWEVSIASDSTCLSHPSTHKCCPTTSTSSEGHACRSQFKCPVDPCTKSDCASNAQCLRGESPRDNPNYTCECPTGLMGSGRACKPRDPKPIPKIMFDGVTPTELTVKNGLYCGCTKPIVDACSGFPPCKRKHEVCTLTADNEPICACKPGYVHHEKYGCVDVHPPTLNLLHDPNGDQTLRLRQGDEYREHMVEIVDENAEDYLRSLKISYSQALPKGCLTQVGEFHVNYTVAMPWANPPYVRITRRVVIDDTDECRVGTKFQHSCPSLVHQCDRAAGAKCVNTIGSYSCQCPKSSSGDGFLALATFSAELTPSAYKGGNSCVDTSKPIIKLNGPNPKIFKICECRGLSGVMSKNKSTDDIALHESQQQLYEQDIKEMIRATSGAELCATYGNPNPSPKDCVFAVDHTYRGDIDLSHKVEVGEPQQKSALHWVVPYNVNDEAGNEATTVWRDIIVQEVDTNSLESKIRQEVLKESKAEREEAIEQALREEKVKWQKEQRNAGSKPSKTCPACPSCDCSSFKNNVDSNQNCQCQQVTHQQWSDNSRVYKLFLWLEDMFLPQVVPMVASGILLLATFFLLRLVMSCFTDSQRYDYSAYGDKNGTSDDELLLLQSSTPGKPVVAATTQLSASTSTGPSMMMGSPPPRNSGPSMMMGSPPPLPRNSLASSTTNNNGNRSFFSPASQPGTPLVQNNGGGGAQPPNQAPTPGSAVGGEHQRIYDESIYNTQSIITPSRTGDGVRRRNPYT